MRFCSMALVERLRDVLLADHVGEPLRAIFAGDDLIGHFRFAIYDLRVAIDCAGNRKSAIANRKFRMPG